jgi:hypothetical protein
VWQGVAATTGHIAAAAGFHESARCLSDRSEAVPDQSEWKRIIGEGNAIGWIGLFVLVVAIGVGTLMFSKPRPHPMRPAIAVTHAAR